MTEYAMRITAHQHEVFLVLTIDNGVETRPPRHTRKLPPGSVLMSEAVKSTDSYVRWLRSTCTE